jgi:hypothetical protein
LIVRLAVKSRMQLEPMQRQLSRAKELSSRRQALMVLTDAQM